MQVWGRDGKLKIQLAGHLGDARAAGSGGAADTATRSTARTRINGIHLRVLSVPLQLGEHRVAVLQVAASLTVVDAARANLVNILLASALVSRGAGGAGLVAGARVDRWRRCGP